MRVTDQYDYPGWNGMLTNEHGLRWNINFSYILFTFIVTTHKYKYLYFNSVVFCRKIDPEQSNYFEYVAATIIATWLQYNAVDL